MMLKPILCWITNLYLSQPWIIHTHIYMHTYMHLYFCMKQLKCKEVKKLAEAQNPVKGKSRIWTLALNFASCGKGNSSLCFDVFCKQVGCVVTWCSNPAILKDSFLLGVTVELSHHLLHQSSCKLPASRHVCGTVAGRGRSPWILNHPRIAPQAPVLGNFPKVKARRD